jgi:hypothetical protein
MRGNVFSNVLECLSFDMNITCFHSLQIAMFYTLLDFCTSRQSLGLGNWGLHCRYRDEQEQRKRSRCTHAETRPFPDFHQVGMTYFFLCNFIHLVCVPLVPLFLSSHFVNQSRIKLVSSTPLQRVALFERNSHTLEIT